MSTYKFIDEDSSIHQSSINGIQFKNEWLKITPDGVITISSHYAWNGCSPKVNFLDITWGTPDGRLNLSTSKPLTYYASKVHDVLYQFKGEHGVTRSEADELFLEMLKKENFILANVYYAFVRIGGWTLGSWKLKNKPRN